MMAGLNNLGKAKAPEQPTSNKGVEETHKGGASGGPELADSIKHTRMESNQNAVDEIKEAQKSGDVQYSSSPIDNFRLGRFRFTKGLLTLKGKDVAEFEKLLEDLPVSESSKLQKLDIELAEQIVRERLAQQPRATKQTDSSTGDRSGGPVVGTGALGDETEAFTNTAQTDMNRPVHGDDVSTPLNAGDAAESSVEKPTE